MQEPTLILGVEIEVPRQADRHRHVVIINDVQLRLVFVQLRLVIVEHDMSVVFGLADRISVLVYGHIIASGTPEEIRGNPKVKEAYLGEEVD